MLQEQHGIFGSIVILPRKGEGTAAMDQAVVLSDCTNKNPMEILRNLRRGSEHFRVEKGTSQSLLGAVKTGKFGGWLGREGMRMQALDLADVAYDAFLVNGKPEESLAVRPGRTIRLRVIDGSASTFFHFTYAGGPMTIVAADGQPVEPLKMIAPLLMGVADTRRPRQGSGPRSLRIPLHRAGWQRPFLNLDRFRRETSGEGSAHAFCL